MAGIVSVTKAIVVRSAASFRTLAHPNYGGQATPELDYFPRPLTCSCQCFLPAGETRYVFHSYHIFPQLEFSILFTARSGRPKMD